MYIYAGIDEAGYGPLFGPLLVARSVVAIPKLPPAKIGEPPPQLWQRLSKAVCRQVAGRKGRIAVNDSKKLTTAAGGVKHLELGCLAFAALADHHATCVGSWLDCMDNQAHHDLVDLPWYQMTPKQPWQALPVANIPGEIAVARGLLTSTAKRIGVDVPDLAASVVFENQFNTMVAATRSKAATSFTFVSNHLLQIWQTFGEHQPLVVVDRQGGRTRYRRLLAMNFPDAEITVLEESPDCSSYRLQGHDRHRAMTIQFQVQAEQYHLPVALASMLAKYTRELLMARLNAYFTDLIPTLKPTAGYALDGQRFWKDLQPQLAGLPIPVENLRRIS
jgi:hypothetical protein